MSTRWSLLLAAVATSALVGPTACSGNSSSPPHTSSPASTSSPPPAAANTGSTTAGAPPGAQILGTPRKGEPFTITIADGGNAQPTMLQITVDSVTCGQLDAAVLAFASVTPTPESGKQYCAVAMEVVNVGNSMAVWDASNKVSLNIGATEYTETQADGDLAGDYEQYWYSKGQVGPAFGINPGSKGPEYGVFEIPVGAAPTSLWVSSGSVIQNINGVQPGYLVLL